MTLVAIWLVTGTLFTIGLLGILLPTVPGLVLVAAGIVFFALATNFAAISLLTTIFLVAIASLAMLAGYFGPAWGSSAAGGSWKSISGALLGSIIGLFTPLGPLGLFVGAFIGALLGALAEGKNIGQAWRIARTSVIGALGASLMQFILGLILIIVFLFAALG